MAPLINCRLICKSYRSRPLFQNLTIAVEEGEKIGVVGPNGAGKSTLMKILSGAVEPDDGTITARKDLRVCYLAQEDSFDGETVSEVLRKAAAVLQLEEHAAQSRVEKQISQFGFPDPLQRVDKLSGGWKKRLAIARELLKEPDLLLLDEPTNHLDLEAVLWLERMLVQCRFSLMLVSHDRQFLQNVSTRIVEINPAYEEGCLSVSGKYTDFLLAREEYFRTQANLEQALASKVRKEISWLQRGARARQTKSSARIKEAGELIDSLSEVRARNTINTKMEIDFAASGRKTRELLVCKSISKALGEKLLFGNLDLVLHPGSKIGLIGANGSGKTTLLKILAGKLSADSGTLKRADNLKIVWFDQNREQLDQSKTLWESLCPAGDSVSYRGQSIHVSTWARRFLFKPDQLHMPISYLSGGEQARILIANLMKEPADLLILDEPTNNLDLPSLAVLEDSLLEFPGAVLLVTHDRFMIHEVPNLILSLDGKGQAEYFADFTQWESALSSQAREQKGDTALKRAAEKPDKNSTADAAKDRNKALSTSEKKELLEITDRIQKAEELVLSLQKDMEEPAIASNHEKLIAAQMRLEQAQEAVEKLYRRWEDLELRQGLST